MSDGHRTDRTPDEGARPRTDQPSGRRGAFALGFVLLSLLALLLVPVVFQHRTDAMEQRLKRALAPAEALTNTMALAMARQEEAVRGFLITGDSMYVDRFREARRMEESAFEQLRPLAQRLGAATESRLQRARELTERWHVRHGPLVDDGPGEVGRYLDAFPRQDSFYVAANAALDTLGTTITTLRVGQRDAIESTMRIGTVLTSILALLALLSGIVVSRMGVRIQRRSREEARLRTQLEESERRTAFLADAGSVLVSSLDYETTLRSVARLAVSFLADFCLIDVVEEQTGIRRIASAHRDPEIEKMARRAERFPPGPPGNPAMTAIRSGRSTLFEEIDDEEIRKWAQSPEHLELIRRLRPRSVMAVPLVARARTLGAIQFALLEGQSTRSYDRQDLVVADELARRAAVAIDNARLYRDRERAQEDAERRAREEEALRQAAQAVLATDTVEDVTRQIAERALDATAGDGAVVVQAGPDRDEVVVVGSAGEITAPLGTRRPYRRSVAELVLERERPERIHRLRTAGRKFPGDLELTCADCSAIVVPLDRAAEALGALILLRAPPRPPFSVDDLERANTFGTLAAIAFRKLRLLQESEHKRHELERVMESRSRLMRGFSHDVKNPLGAADGYAQLLELGVRNGLSPAQKQTIERMRRSIGTALDLINDLLELARAETGQMELRLEPTDAGAAARDAAQDYRPPAEAAGLALETHVAPGLPEVRTDASRVRQILSNLLSNAVKYTEEGSVTVRVQSREDGRAPEPGRWLAVDIADTGPGIPPVERKHLFREFSRLERAGKGGAGLGLAMSRRIARLLGGDITVESTVGEGSTFTLWLPLDESMAARRRDRVAPRGPAPGST